MTKVLIVDDSALARMLIQRSLASLEWECCHAGDGNVALEMLAEDSFDIIFMDWNMPNLQGIDAVREIRKTGNVTPIIMVSGLKDELHAEEAKKAGANGFITKPFNEEQFQAAVLEFLESSSAPAG